MSTDNVIEGWGGGTPKTDPALLARLIAAARDHKMTPQERFAQRVSFVYGQMNGAVSKAWVRAHLAGDGGSAGAESWDGVEVRAK